MRFNMTVQAGDLVRGVSHEGLIVDSLALYRAHLQSASERRINAATKAAIDLLMRTLDTAEQTRSELSVAHIGFDGGSLAAVPADELGLFVNQWALGFGAPDARVIVMGTEHAYDAADPDTLALESCMSAVMWLAGASPDFVARVCRDSQYAQPWYRPYQRSPLDYSPH